MGGCATKPQIKADEADAAAPEPVEEVVKNAAEVRVEEEPNDNHEKSKDGEDIVLDDEKQRSLASLLVQKEGGPAVEASAETKEEKPRVADDVEAEPAKETTESAPSAAAEEVKKSDEKATDDGKE